MRSFWTRTGFLILTLQLFACSASLHGDGSQPEIAGPPPPSNGPVAGTLDHQPWKMGGGQAIRFSGSDGDTLEVTLWDDPSRPPCVMTSNDDSLKSLFIITRPALGQTRHDYGAYTPNTQLSFTYSSNGTRVSDFATSGSSFIDEIDSSHVVGHLAVSAGDGFKASGVYNVTICH